jgi:hypothetical protein
MDYNAIGLIMEQFENMGLLYDTGERRNGEVVFELSWEPSPEKMNELYHYMQSEPAAYEFLAEMLSANGLSPCEISAAIGRLGTVGDNADNSVLDPSARLTGVNGESGGTSEQIPASVDWRGVMNGDEIPSIMEQFKNIGLLYDTGKRRNGQVVFSVREPSPKMLDELYHYMQSEPAAYEVLALLGRASGLNPGEISATISRLKKLSTT